MSGRRLRNPRQGDRSEYLATYLLSALGLTTAVPRQEDIGFDFHCNLSDQEQGLLTFGFPFLVQIKSAGSPVFELLPAKDFSPIPGQIPDHLAWLWRQELPLYLGIIDKDKLSLRLHSLAPFWFITYECRNCAGVRFIPRSKADDDRHIGRPVPSTTIKGDKDACVYDIDVGHPIAEFNAHDAQDDDRMAAEKDRLRFCIDFEMRNLVFFRAKLPHFYWFAETKRDKWPGPAFFYRELVRDPEWLGPAYAFIGPALIPFARRYQEDGNTAALAALKTLYREMPSTVVPPEVRAALPEVFGP